MYKYIKYIIIQKLLQYKYFSCRESVKRNNRKQKNPAETRGPRTRTNTRNTHTRTHAYIEASPPAALNTSSICFTAAERPMHVLCTRSVNVHADSNARTRAYKDTAQQVPVKERTVR